jgi:outer membrane protein OmpA-like peptidoglycan-associated protein
MEAILYEEFHKAVPYLNVLVTKDPENAYYNYWLGKCLFLSYRKNMALYYLNKAALVDNEVEEDFHELYAQVLHYNFKFDQAIDEYKHAMENYDPGTAPFVKMETCITQCKYAKKAMDNKNPDWDRVRIRNAGDSINTEYAEHSPVISGNDSILLWTARRPESFGADPERNFYDEDLYMSFKRGDVWAEGQNVGYPVNSKGHDATISLSADGRTLYLYSQKDKGGIFRTTFDTTGQKWRDPERVERPLNSKAYETCICVSADGNKMIFTSDREGGFGGLDLYMVKRIGDDQWTEPFNLGPTINSPFNEDAPYFHPDNKTLYYSHDGPASMGGYDIFVTEYNEAANTWLDPLNMGFPVNTPDEDIYFVLSEDGLTGYYSSGKEGGFGEKDIYIIDFPYYPYPRRYFNIQLEGTVVDKITRDTLPAVVRLIDKTTNEIRESRVNRIDPKIYNFELLPDHEYVLEVISENYPVYTEDFVAPRLSGKDIKIVRNIELEKPVVVVGEDKASYFEIQHIYYHFDKFWLRDESLIELDRVVQVMAENKDLNLQLHGHTDWFNTLEYNQTLSWNRCNAPYDYLLSQGIDPSRIEFVTHSENRPIDTNEDDPGRQFNRRCEFHFYKGEDLVFTSVRERSGAPPVYVDHTAPKGRPGYDRPELVRFMGNAILPGVEPEGSMGEATQQQEKLRPFYTQENRNFRIRITLVD